jgi:hypothetical protein
MPDLPIPETEREAIRAWAPRCYACGEIARYQTVTPKGSTAWVFTNGLLSKIEFIEGDGESAADSALRVALIWSGWLNSLGLYPGIDHHKRPEIQNQYYCEKHIHPEAKILPYLDLLLTLIGGERPECPTRFERMLEEDA